MTFIGACSAPTCLIVTKPVPGNVGISSSLNYSATSGFGMVAFGAGEEDATHGLMREVRAHLRGSIHPPIAA